MKQGIFVPGGFGRFHRKVNLSYRAFLGCVIYCFASKLIGECAVRFAVKGLIF